MPAGRTGSRLLRPTLPTWIPPDQPLYLNSAIRKRIRRSFQTTGIFLNIPYSERYSSLEVAIISTVIAYGLTPRMARERSRTEVRMLKIAEIMLTSQYGMTDLSYVSRMNMPLELGMLLAFGKETFIASRTRYGGLRTISDLNFADIHYHEGRPRRLIMALAKWIEQTCGKRPLSTDSLIQCYRRVRRLRTQLGDDFDRLTPQQIAGLISVAMEALDLKLTSISDLP